MLFYNSRFDFGKDNSSNDRIMKEPNLSKSCSFKCPFAKFGAKKFNLEH